MMLADELEAALRELSELRGVAKVRLLTEGERAEVLRLEEEHSRRPLKGLGAPRNVGVAECLRRKHVVAMLTTDEFEWPPGPYALIRVCGVVVGEVRECGIVFFRERVARVARSRCSREVVFLPLRPPEPLARRFRNLIFASPSPPSHSYLVKLVGAEGEGLGTMLAGFDGYAM